MTDEEIRELSDLNVAEATREMARWHPDSRLLEERGALYSAGADPFPVGFMNAGLATGRAPADPEELLARGDAFFGALGRGWTVWVRTHLDDDLERLCIDAEHLAVGDSPGMVLESPCPEAPLPAARFAPVEDEATARDLVHVAAGAYATVGMPEEVTRKGFEHVRGLLQPHVEAVVAYVDDEPAACALAILAHGSAGLYWVGTLPNGRGRGLGEAVTRLVGNRAFERGAECVVLQASQQGEPIYRRMGYREVTRYRWWLRPARAAPGRGGGVGDLDR